MSDWVDVQFASANIRDCEALEVCGTCGLCRHRAALAVGSWVIRQQRRRKSVAVGSPSLEQRRYVRDLTVDMLDVLGLVPPQSEASLVRQWARSMRARRK